jgi:predicted nuclease with TOPRIM domain
MRPLYGDVTQHATDAECIEWKARAERLERENAELEGELRRLRDEIDQIALEVDEQWILDRLRGLFSTGPEAVPESGGV